MTSIEWTDKTWNPAVGCSRISKGCEHCYAEGVAHRGMTERHRGLTVLRPGGKGPRWNGVVRMVPEVLDVPLRRKKPTRYFVNSMSDLFHEELVGYEVTVEHVTKLAVPFWTIRRADGRPVGSGWTVVEEPGGQARLDPGALVFLDEAKAQAKAAEIRAAHEKGRRFIAAVFGVMAACEQHTFQILTKRPDQARRWFEWAKGQHEHWGTWRDVIIDPLRWSEDHAVRDSLARAAASFDGWKEDIRVTEPAWPLPNVWVGVSVEDQVTADARIPVLLELPAAVRFLSCEPLLGPVSLARWMPPRTPVQLDDAPESWSEFPWPDWVPGKTRAEIEGFWSDFGRGPRDYIKDCIQQNSPPFGARFRSERWGWRESDGEGRRWVEGRWVHCWNNIGRLIDDDGAPQYASTPCSGLLDFESTRRQWQPLHWVIAGGESGNGARPMHPDWARGLRDQCVAADVPFLFKQHGAWTFEETATRWSAGGPIPEMFEDPSEVLWMTTQSSTDPKRVGERTPYILDGDRARRGWKLGKKKAGRELDGRTWDQFPGENKDGE